MAPNFTQLPQIKVIGRSVYGPVSSLRDMQDGGRIIKDFNDGITRDRVLERIPHCVHPGTCIVLCIDYHKQKGICSYLVGAEVSTFFEVPEDMVSRTVPPATYVEFEIESEDTLGDLYSFIMEKWLPCSGYKKADMSESLEIYNKTDWSGKVLIPVVKNS